MNALELADELDNMLKAIGLTNNRVTTMLRQLQAENEALKKERDLLFKAHSTEMKRADELKAELEDLYDKAPLDWEKE